MTKSIEKVIVGTIAYFDLFEYPVTLVELKRWLLMSGHSDLCKKSIGDLFENWKTSEFLKSQIIYKDGFFCLKNRENVEDFLNQRAEKYRLTQQKMKRAHVALRLFSSFPFVRFIGVANRVGWGVAREKSDIDFFIVARSGRLWLTRMLVTGCAVMFGWRPNKLGSSNKICLSYYMSDKNFDVGDARFQKEDVHYAFWLYQLFPLYDESGIFERLLNANLWLSLFFCEFSNAHLRPRVQNSRSLVKSFFEFIFGGFVGDLLEKIMRLYQIKVLNKKLKSIRTPYDSAVVFNDDVIKLHWEDKREFYYKEWKRTLLQVGI